MSYASFLVGGSSVNYITSEQSAEKIGFVNLRDLEAETKKEQRENAIAYADVRVQVEKSKRKKARMNYTLLLSWDRKESSETALRMAKNFVKKNFPGAKAIIGIHQDTDNTHAHIWLDARKTDGRKLHFKKDEYSTIDERWHLNYDKQYGTNYFVEMKKKKIETAEFKIAKAEGRKVPKPARAADKFNNEYWRKKEIEKLTGEKIKIIEMTQAEKTLPAAVRKDAQKENNEEQNREENDQKIKRENKLENNLNEQNGLGSDQSFVTGKDDEARGAGQGTEPAKRDPATAERKDGGAEPTVEAIAEQLERKQQFARTIGRRNADEMRIDDGSDEEFILEDRRTGTGEFRDQKEPRTNQIRTIGNENESAATDRMGADGRGENGELALLFSSGANKEQRTKPIIQPKFDLDGESSAINRDRTLEEKESVIENESQSDNLFTENDRNIEGTETAPDESEKGRVSEREFYLNRFGGTSSGEGSNPRNAERSEEENKQSGVNDPADELDENYLIGDDYFYEMEVISVYNPASGTFAAEIVYAGSAALMTELLTSQLGSAENAFNYLDSVDSPTVNAPVILPITLPEADSLALRIIQAQIDQQNSEQIGVSAANQVPENAFENLKTEQSQFTSSVAEASEILAETENALVRGPTEIEDEKMKFPKLFSEEKSIFEIKDEIQLNSQDEKMKEIEVEAETEAEAEQDGQELSLFD